MSNGTTPILLQKSHVIVEEKVGPKTGTPLVALAQWDLCPGGALSVDPDYMVVLAREDALTLARWILGRFSQ